MSLFSVLGIAALILSYLETAVNFVQKGVDSALGKGAVIGREALMC